MMIYIVFGVLAALAVANMVIEVLALLERRRQNATFMQQLRMIREEQSMYKTELVAHVSLLAKRTKDAVPKIGDRQAHLALMRQARGD